MKRAIFFVLLASFSAFAQEDAEKSIFEITTVEAGGAYLSATGSITSQTASVTESKTQSIGLPLAGLEFRVFPVHRRFDVEINGEARGMAFGSYGYYSQAQVNAGVGYGPMLVEGGYRIVNFDIHTANMSTIVNPQFTGPIVSVVFRMPWRFERLKVCAKPDIVRASSRSGNQDGSFLC